LLSLEQQQRQGPPQGRELLQVSLTQRLGMQMLWCMPFLYPPFNY
jgi:hypothetical protein